MNPQSPIFRLLAPAIVTWLVISFLATLVSVVRTALYFSAPLSSLPNPMPHLVRCGWLMGLLLLPIIIIVAVLLRLPPSRPLWFSPHWSWLAGVASALPALWIWFEVLYQSGVIKGDFFNTATFEAVFTVILSVLGGLIFSLLHSFLIRRANQPVDDRL